MIDIVNIYVDRCLFVWQPPGQGNIRHHGKGKSIKENVLLLGKLYVTIILCEM